MTIVVGLPAALAAGLPGVAERSLRPGPDVLGWACDERVVSVIASARRSGHLVLPAGLASEFIHEHEAAMYRCVLLERALAEVADVLVSSRVRFRLLKGPAVAHLDYPDPMWRTFGDLDLLVPATDYDAAVRSLERWGARRRSLEVQPDFDRRFGKGVCMIGAEGVQVDLHRMLSPGAFGLSIDPEELFADADEVVIGGDRYLALTRQHRFLHACLHVLGDWPHRLMPLRDVAQLRLATDLDFATAVRTAERWRCRQVLAYAVAESATMLGLPDDPMVDWAAGYRGSRFEARSLSSAVGVDRSYARSDDCGAPSRRRRQRQACVRSGTPAAGSQLSRGS